MGIVVVTEGLWLSRLRVLSTQFYEVILNGAGYRSRFSGPVHVEILKRFNFSSC